MEQIKTENKVKKKKKMKITIIRLIMNYSLLITFIVGMISVIFGVFKDLSLPVIVLCLLFSILYVIFFERTSKKEFYFLISTASMFVVLGTVITYLPIVLAYLELNDVVLNSIRNYVIESMIVLLSTTLIPSLKAAFNLIFLKSKD